MVWACRVAEALAELGPRPHPALELGVLRQPRNLPSCATCWPSAIAAAANSFGYPALPERGRIHAPSSTGLGAERIGLLEGWRATSWTRTEHQPPPPRPPWLAPFPGRPLLQCLKAIARGVEDMRRLSLFCDGEWPVRLALMLRSPLEFYLEEARSPAGCSSLYNEGWRWRPQRPRTGLRKSMAQQV